jgi:hypothetical protein
MGYKAFTKSSLRLMYETIRGALASDDTREKHGQEPSFRVRETWEWKEHATALEAEMLKRGMLFEILNLERRPEETSVRVTRRSRKPAARDVGPVPKKAAN